MPIESHDSRVVCTSSVDADATTYTAAPATVATSITRATGGSITAATPAGSTTHANCRHTRAAPRRN
jgi:DNA-binding transcriptional regulator YdaS (Cro superfamily)